MDDRVSAGGAGADYERVREWEEGLPSADELTPLSQCLISPQLASAFRIISDIPPFHTPDDVNRASHSIVAILRGISSVDADAHSNPLVLDHERHCYEDVPASDADAAEEIHHRHNIPVLGDIHQNKTTKPDCRNATTLPYSDIGLVSMPNRNDAVLDAETDAALDVEPEEVDSAPAPSENPNEDSSSRTPKRPRLVWTPELHKRFIEAVGHLGINNAVPKTIMQLMNVEGLTRENVASHLQKYRLYLKRMQGLSTEGPSSSDHIFASTPVPPSVAMQSGFFAGARPPHPPPDESMPSSFGPPPYGPIPITRSHVVGTPNSAGQLPPPPPHLDPYPYHVFVPPTMQRFVQPDPKQVHSSGQHQESPSHHILRLFPAGK